MNENEKKAPQKEKRSNRAGGSSTAKSCWRQSGKGEKRVNPTFDHSRVAVDLEMKWGTSGERNWIRPALCLREGRGAYQDRLRTRSLGFHKKEKERLATPQEEGFWGSSKAYISSNEDRGRRKETG